MLRNTEIHVCYHASIPSTLIDDWKYFSWTFTLAKSVHVFSYLYKTLVKAPWEESGFLENSLWLLINSLREAKSPRWKSKKNVWESDLIKTSYQSFLLSKSCFVLATSLSFFLKRVLSKGWLYLTGHTLDFRL